MSNVTSKQARVRVKVPENPFATMILNKKDYDPKVYGEVVQEIPAGKKPEPWPPPSE
jgi:hypothetical protein